MHRHQYLHTARHLTMGISQWASYNGQCKRLCEDRTCLGSGSLQLTDSAVILLLLHIHQALSLRLKLTMIITKVCVTLTFECMDCTEMQRLNRRGEAQHSWHDMQQTCMKVCA